MEKQYHQDNTNFRESDNLNAAAGSEKFIFQEDSSNDLRVNTQARLPSINRETELSKSIVGLPGLHASNLSEDSSAPVASVLSIEPLQELAFSMDSISIIAAPPIDFLPIADLISIVVLPPIIDPDPIVVLPPIIDPDPIVGLPPIIDPDPIVGLPPIIDPNPIVGLPPIIDPNPIVGLPPIIDPDPIVGLPPIIDPDPIVGLPPIIDPNPIIGLPPIIDPGPIVGLPPIIDPGPIVSLPYITVEPLTAVTKEGLNFADVLSDSSLYSGIAGTYSQLLLMDRESSQNQMNVIGDDINELQLLNNLSGDLELGLSDPLLVEFI